MALFHIITNLVLLLDTLDYPTETKAKTLSPSTIQLLRHLCKSSTDSRERITVRVVNVYPQEETGKDKGVVSKLKCWGKG